MNTTASTSAAYTIIRQRIVSAIAVAAFILAMLLGGGAPADWHSIPQPTPATAQTAAP